MRTWSWMACTTVFAVLGCSQGLTPDSNKQARERWDQVRSRLKCQLAAETFSSGQVDQAQKHLQEALALDPKLPEAHVLRAKILLERGETASASEALDEALHCGADTAETDYLSGIIAQRYGNLANALAWYQRAAQREPTSAHYVASVAETLVGQGRAADALALVKQRWTDFEQNATLRALAGGIYIMLGRYEEAADAYREAVRIAPDDRVLQGQLGLALTRSGSYKEGADVLTPLTEGKDEVSPLVLTAAGRCHLALEQAESAKTLLARAAQAEPDNARLWGLLTRASIECGDMLSARRAAGRAVQAQPDAVEYTLLLAYVCHCQRDIAAATPLLERVLGRTPDDELAKDLLARCRQQSVAQNDAPTPAPAAARETRRAASMQSTGTWSAHAPPALPEKGLRSP